MGRPDILFIMTDQQRFDTITALRNSHIYTPNMDRAVRRGISFSSAYATSPFVLPRDIRSAPDVSRRRPAFSVMRRQMLWPVKPWRWKRVAGPTWDERCRASVIERLESESSIQTHGTKTSASKPSGAAKKLTVRQIAKAMTTVRGCSWSIRSSISSSNRWANGPRCFTFRNAARFQRIWAENGGRLIARLRKSQSHMNRGGSSDLCRL